MGSSRADPVVLRRATAADAAALGRAGVEGLDGYEAFAPAGWSPPAAAEEADHLVELLATADAWCLLAEAGGAIVGQVTVLPAARAGRPVDEPGLAHLRNLVVREDRRGTTLARDLLAAAVDAARDRGFTALRLFTPAAHARARRFYEREGWAAVGEPSFDAAPGLEVVEYRRGLG